MSEQGIPLIRMWKLHTNAAKELLKNPLIAAVDALREANVAYGCSMPND